MAETDDLTHHPRNVKGRESVLAKLERHLRACCRRPFTGAVKVDVIINGGFIYAAEAGVTEHDRFSDADRLTAARPRV